MMQDRNGRRCANKSTPLANSAQQPLKFRQQQTSEQDKHWQPLQVVSFQIQEHEFHSRDWKWLCILSYMYIISKQIQCKFSTIL